MQVVANKKNLIICSRKHLNRHPGMDCRDPDHMNVHIEYVQCLS